VEARNGPIRTDSFKRQRTRSPEYDFDMKNEEKFDPQEAEIESLDFKPKEIVYNPDNDAEAPFKLIAAERK